MKKIKSWLNGKTIIITGVTGGLGSELAKQLIFKFDAKVLGIARNPEKMEKLITEISSPNFTPILFDVSKNANWADFAQKLAQNSTKVDILINNAGVMPAFKRFETHTLDEIEKVFSTNLFSCMYAVKNMLPLMQKSSEPAIVNIASACAYAAVIGTSIYQSSKLALKGFTDTIREENKTFLVSGVYPGFIKTELFREKALAGKLEKFASTPSKIAKNILSGLNKKRKNITVGFDGKLIKTFSRIMPNLASPVMAKVLTSSGEEHFKGLTNNGKRN